MAPRRKVLVIKGVANYDHLRCFVDYLRLGFAAEGAEVVEIDLARGPLSVETFERTATWDADLVLAINAEGAHLAGPGGRPLGGGAVPLTCWMLDEPYYQPHWDQVLRLPYVRTLWSNDETRGHAAAMGLPDPGRLDLAARALPRVRDEDRTIDVLFVGSIVDPDAMRSHWSAQLGTGIAALMDALIERWAADEHSPIRDAFRAIAEERGLADHAGLIKVAPFVLGEVNRYVRNRRRLDLVRALRGTRMTVVGDGWGRLVDGHAFDLVPAVPFPLFEEMVSDARITLALQPIHAHGASERFFASLANGSALVVNENRWLEEEYPAGSFAPYDRTDPESVRERLEELRADRTRRIEMAELALAHTLAHHTWRHRAAELLARTAGTGRGMAGTAA
ncbi:MAG: glycosyltransferase [Sandaracinaceae bacterium]